MRRESAMMLCNQQRATEAMKGRRNDELMKSERASRWRMCDEVAPAVANKKEAAKVGGEQRAEKPLGCGKKYRCLLCGWVRRRGLGEE
jgi:hypothetical protein